MIVVECPRERTYAIHETLAAALADSNDLIITSGGVSVGDFDLVKNILKAEGQIDFWQVNMRPWRPLAFGWLHNIPLPGLPDNPIAVFTGMSLFGRAILSAMQRRNPAPILYEAIREAPIRNGSKRRKKLRGTATLRRTKLTVHEIGGQLPTQLSPLAHGNCLIVAMEDRTLYEAGESIQIVLLEPGLLAPFLKCEDRGMDPGDKTQTPIGGIQADDTGADVVQTHGPSNNGLAKGAS